MQTKQANWLKFLKGGGEMGDLIRAFNWADTSVGSPDSWPQSLLTTVSLILSSKFPMFLWWGPELIQFYNDAYQPSLGNQGKHPTALGQRGQDCWPEIWPTIKPLIDHVLAGEESIWQENQLIPIYRNGRLDDVYWTFSYSAVLTDSGEIGGVLVVCQETTDVVTSHQKIAQSEARFRSIVEQAPMAIGLLSGKDMVIEVGNDVIFEVWGKNKSITGMHLIDALPELKGQVFLDLLAEVYTTGEPYFGNGVLAKLEKGGELKNNYFDFVYTPLRDMLGVVTGVMVLATEVTAQVLAKQQLEESEARFRALSKELDQQVHQRTEQLQASIQDLQRSNQNLQQFAYIASHDLQEPLRKIQQFSNLLQLDYAAQLGEGIDLLARMQASASRMSTLIRDLLSYSRISTHQNTTDSVSLTNVVRMAIQDLDLMIQELGAVIDAEPLPTVRGDSSQLGQLFQNLLTNALKFRRAMVTPVIKITCQTIPATDLPPAVRPTRSAVAYYRIDVTDNGIGFKEIYLDRIFQVFQRLHGNNVYPGTGIGLAICEKVVANHGGIITATSQVGQGSTFLVYLPV